MQMRSRILRKILEWPFVLFHDDTELPSGFVAPRVTAHTVSSNAVHTVPENSGSLLILTFSGENDNGAHCVLPLIDSIETLFSSVLLCVYVISTWNSFLIIMFKADLLLVEF